MQYRCKYFVIKELVHPTLLKQLGEDLCWQLFDDRILKCADMIREKYGSCTVNTANLNDCGMRDINSTTGAKYSMHKLCRGLDLHIKDIEIKYSGKKAEKIKAYNKIREQLMLDPRFDCLSFENNISWLHCDTGNRKNRLFNP